MENTVNNSREWKFTSICLMLLVALAIQTARLVSTENELKQSQKENEELKLNQKPEPEIGHCAGC